MTYEEALKYIGSRLRFGIKPGLERTRRLLAALGEPQDSLRFIHVAGTNGKGSVCAMTSAALMEAGCTTGLYTSPYITDFRERMQINGEMIGKDELAQLTEEVAAHVGDADEITEFELITCIAMLWFARRGCDCVVLETGLGGRFDATNVIKQPVCATITRIDYDHTAVLGDTLAAIAGEKAGIFKEGCPVVIEPYQPQEALAVLKDTARRLGCPVVQPDEAAIEVVDSTLSGTDIRYDGVRLHIPFAGAHQIANAVTAVETLRAAGVAEDAIVRGIAKARIPARLEVISTQPPVIIDGAHNPNGAAALADAIDALLADKRVFAVMGVLRDKDYTAELKLLGSRFERIYTCGGFSERALSGAELARIAEGYTERVVPFESCESAFDGALSAAVAEDAAVVVCGSLYLAGAVRGYAIKTIDEIK
ncbi:MAG: bifunctional folylpolyglutamate synthase/dihydrofolate synthase [Ruminococcaceae bacterium]|nr:bifunctional folylpolyglutamate synthase/dihydrofolate synthase [Oscillospiraceae bacterium]